MEAYRYYHYKNVYLLCLICLAFLGVACNDATQAGKGAVNGAGGGAAAHTAPAKTRSAQATVVVSYPPALKNTSGTGPLVISTPVITSQAGVKRQIISLKDRVLAFSNVVSKVGANNTLIITLNVSVDNTSSQPVANAPVFYQVVAAEGDTFGLNSGVATAFFGTINAHAVRSGTITFVVPAAAAKDLHLLYRPEIATETVLFPLLNQG